MADYEGIPQQAVDSLLANPEKADGFDQVFGKGRAEEVLAGRDPQPEPKANKSPQMADYEEIPQKAIDSLLANPEEAGGFDQVFGKGRAAEVLAGRDPQPEPKANKSPQMADYEGIPQQAVDSLLANPEKASGFDQVFGKGRAEEVLASRDPQPKPKARSPLRWGSSRRYGM